MVYPYALLLLGGFPVSASVLSLGRFLATCVHIICSERSTSSYMYNTICWLSPSNQRFYRLIAGYQRKSVGDHNGRPMTRRGGGGDGPTRHTVYSYIITCINFTLFWFSFLAVLG